MAMELQWQRCEFSEDEQWNGRINQMWFDLTDPIRRSSGRTQRVSTC